MRVSFPLRSILSSVVVYDIPIVSPRAFSDTNAIVDRASSLECMFLLTKVNFSQAQYTLTVV